MAAERRLGSILGGIVAESLVLTVVAAAAGGFLAWTSGSVVSEAVRYAFPFHVTLAFDARSFCYLVAAAMTTVVITAGLPAFVVGAGRDLRDALGAGGVRSGGSIRLRQARGALIVVQVSLSLTLLVGAGLLLRTVMALGATDPGIDPSSVMTAHTPSTEARPGAEPAASFFRPVLQRLRAAPGVVSAGAISLLPLQEAYTNGGFRVEGQPATASAKASLAEYRVVTPGYFKTLRIGILAGRDVAESDDAPLAAAKDSTRAAVRPDAVVLVNAAFARRYLSPGQPLSAAVGKRLLDVGYDRPATVVGVVADVRQASLELATLPEIYFPYAGMDAGHGADKMDFVLRSTLGDRAAGETIRRVVASVAPAQPVSMVLSMSDVMKDATAKQRLYAMLLGGLGITALVLTGAGVYSVLSYLVSRRRREVSVRLALGASEGNVIGLLVREGLAMTAVGLALGLACAFVLTRSLQSALYGVTSTDPMSFLVGTTVIVVVALLAIVIPARRAAGMSPALALRAE